MGHLAPALLIPIGVVLVVFLLIVGIGEVLLGLATIMHHFGDVKEPLSVLAALVLAAFVLLIAAVMARRTKNGHGA